MNRIMNYAGCVGRYLRDTRAVAAMEYAIIVGIIVVGVGAAVTAFQGKIVELIDNAAEKVGAEATKIKTPPTN